MSVNHQALHERNLTYTAEETNMLLGSRIWQLLQSNFLDELPYEQPQLQEVQVNGPHQYHVIDETTWPSGAFKSNGAEYAIYQLVRDQPEVETVLAPSAGNWVRAVAGAAERFGLKTLAYVPHNISPAKEQPLQVLGATVCKSYATDMGEEKPFDNVEEAAQIGLREAEASNGRIAYLHPFNDLNGIAGQSMVGMRIVEGLKAVLAADRNAAAMDTNIHVQIGGGSLIAGIAFWVHRAIAAGDLPANTHVIGVRPELIRGELNSLFDGVRVKEQGSYANAYIQDPTYVKEVVTIDELHAGKAAHRLAMALGGKRIEPAGLVGAAAFEQYAANKSSPTRYVHIASGKNVTEETYKYLTEATKRNQAQLLGTTLRVIREESNPSFKKTNFCPKLTYNDRHLGPWSGPTAHWRDPGLSTQH